MHHLLKSGRNSIVAHVPRAKMLGNNLDAALPRRVRWGNRKQRRLPGRALEIRTRHLAWPLTKPVFPHQRIGAETETVG